MLNDVSAGPDGTIWAAGSNCQVSEPLLLRSTDAGLTWQVHSSPGKDSISDVDVLPGGDLWISAFGTLAHSKDGGGTWTTSSPDPADPLVPLAGVSFADANRGIAGKGTGLTLYETADGGATWTAMSYAGGAIKDLWVAPSGIGHLITNSSNGQALCTLYSFNLP